MANLRTTFKVIDADDQDQVSHQEVVVGEDRILPFSDITPEKSRTTADFILPPGRRVLALWPGSTSFYPATVLARGDIPVGSIRGFQI